MVRVVVIAGAGKAFCSGHDLKEMRANHSKEYMQALFRQCGELMLTITRMPQPVIARVHGIATAARCQLVSMCDLASPPMYPNSPFLASMSACSVRHRPLAWRAISVARRLEMLTGDFIDAMEAGKGLVNVVVLPDALDAEIERPPAASFSKSAIAIRTGKGMFPTSNWKWAGEAHDYAAGSDGLQHDERWDAGEGIDAFMQKRKPNYTGR